VDRWYQRLLGPTSAKPARSCAPRRSTRASFLLLASTLAESHPDGGLVDLDVGGEHFPAWRTIPCKSEGASSRRSRRTRAHARRVVLLAREEPRGGRPHRGGVSAVEDCSSRGGRLTGVLCTLPSAARHPPGGSRPAGRAVGTRSARPGTPGSLGRPLRRRRRRVSRPGARATPAHDWCCAATAPELAEFDGSSDVSGGAVSC